MRPRKSISDYELAVLSEMFVGRRGRLRAYVFEIATAVAWAMVGLAYLTAPQATALHSPVGHDLGVFEDIWSVLEIVGGLGVVVGAMRPSLGVRAAGLLILGTGLAMQFVAVIASNPDMRVVNYAVFGAACFARAALIWRMAARAGRWQPAEE